MENQFQVNKKFAQIPNKMFFGTDNDEKLTYVLLQTMQLTFPPDEKTGMIRVFLSLLSKQLSLRSGHNYSEARVELILMGLQKKGYIIFGSNQSEIVFKILKIDTEEEHKISVNWKSRDIILTGVTEINYKTFFGLFKEKDFTLYAYAKYRMGESYEYRITYDEWAFILWGKREDAMTYIKKSEVIVKFTDRYDGNYGGRRPNTYITFDSVPDEHED